VTNTLISTNFTSTTLFDIYKVNCEQNWNYGENYSPLFNFGLFFCTDCCTSTGKCQRNSETCPTKVLLDYHCFIYCCFYVICLIVILDVGCYGWRWTYTYNQIWNACIKVNSVPFLDTWVYISWKVTTTCVFYESERWTIKYDIWLFKVLVGVILILAPKIILF